MKQENQQKIEWIIRSKIKRAAKEPVEIKYLFIEKSRKRDLDNIASFAHKVIQDALVCAGVLQNDGWANVIGFSDRFSTGKEGRIEVEIFEKGELSDE